MNDGPKEPQEQDKYSTSSSKKCNWFLASVEMHIRNSEWIDPNDKGGVRYEGNNKNSIIK